MKGQKPVPPVTFTCKEAAQRHRGTKRRDLARLCLYGEYLRDKYGGEEKVPITELRRRRYLFAKKCGKSWQIPVKELDRLFLGR